MSHEYTPPGELFLLQNVQGLTSDKLAQAMLWARNKHASLTILTETQLSTDPAELLQKIPGAGVLWPGARLHSVPGTGHTGGLLVILSPSTSITDVKHIDIPSQQPVGRVLRLDFKLDTLDVSLLGVYGPAQPEDRATFFSTTLPAFFPSDHRPVIVGGDWNCVLDQQDCFYPQGTNPPARNTRAEGAPQLQQQIDNHHLHDIWREAHPHLCDFTHFSNSARSGARLDRWLVNHAFKAAFTSSSSIEPASPLHSDHLPVSLGLQRRSPSFRGMGIKSFPLMLLNIPQGLRDFEQWLEEKVEAFTAANSNGDLMMDQWTALKQCMVDKANTLYRRHLLQRSSATQAADRRALAARASFLTGTSPSTTTLTPQQAWHEAQQHATETWRSLTMPVVQASDILNHVAADTSSYYFFNSAKTPRSPSRIEKLNRPGRAADADPETADLSTREGTMTALSYGQAFYSSASPFGLFRVRQDIDAQQQQEILAKQTRHLDETQALLAEGPAGDSLLSLADIKMALGSTQNGKAPGLDGIPYEVYRAFQSLLLPAIVKVFNAAFQETLSPAPLSHLLCGIITLIHKPRQPADELMGYRPITLLGCDVKLVMKVISCRLKRPLDFLIDVMQSAFLRGRDISDNVRYHLGLAARLKELGLPGWLVQSDLTKAYDTIDRGYFYQVMASRGFKITGILRWFRITMDGSTARVRINGILSPDFPVDNGFTQGGPHSPDGWALILQPHFDDLQSLQLQHHLPSLPLPCGKPAPPAAAHADDVTGLLLKPDIEGPELRASFQRSHKAGNPAQSIPKTGLLLLHHPSSSGPLPDTLNPDLTSHHPPTGYALLKLDTPHRLLGAPLGGNPDQRAAFAFNKQPGAMRAVAAQWANNTPSRVGRSVVAGQCLASKAVYQLSFVRPTAQQFRSMQSAVNSFVATSPWPWEETPFQGRLYPSETTAFLPITSGGLGIPNLQVMSVAIQAKTMWKGLCFSSHPWVDLFRHELQRAPGFIQGKTESAHWILLNPDIGINPEVRPTLSDFTVEAIEAFQKLRVQRILTPEDQDFHSIMLEPTFYNLVDGGAAIPLDNVRSPTAQSWHSLALVRQAHQSFSNLSEGEQQDLQLILSSLPPSWRAAILDPSPPLVPWLAVSDPADNDQYFQGPDPVTERIQIWQLWPSGRLQHVTHPWVVRNPSDPRLRPALIILKPKPREDYTADDTSYMAAQALFSPDNRGPPIEEPWFQGYWDSMPVDPRVWGLDSPRSPKPISLLNLQVRDARLHLLHLQALECEGYRGVLGYKEEHAAWPMAWSREDPTVVTDPTASTSDTVLQTLGIAGIEEHWRRQADLFNAPHPPDHINHPPAWLDLSTSPTPRPSRQERQSLAGVAPTIPLRSGFAQVWLRLADPTLHRPFRTVGQDILHGTLGCNGFLYHVRCKPRRDNPTAAVPHPSTACCTNPACFVAGQTETIRHTFLDCPAVQPVISWMREVWKVLATKYHEESGTGDPLPAFTEPPTSAAALLVDDLDAWPDHPTDPRLLCLWNRLRLNTLGAIWMTRCQRAELVPGVSFARTAVTLAIKHLGDAVMRDWLRSNQDVRNLDNGSFCAGWWKGFDRQLDPRDFEHQWPPFFHVIQSSLPPIVASSLTLLITISTPIAAPP